VKKILGLSIAALLVLGLVGGGTWAYFSDTETSTGNFFAVGTLDLEVNGADPLTGTLIDGSSVQLAPGDSLTQVSIPCDNTGNLTGDLYVRISSVVAAGGYTDGPNNTSSEPEYVAEGGTFTGTTPDNNNTPDDAIDTVMTLDADESGVGAVTGLDGVTVASAASTGWIKVKDDFASGATYTLLLGATLPTTVTNEHQGDTVTFTLDFALTQVDQTP
jgi:predicted ribosomally synthesized peptide with SipW-like signal peptide